MPFCSCCCCCCWCRDLNSPEAKVSTDVAEIVDIMMLGAEIGRSQVLGWLEEEVEERTRIEETSLGVVL